MSKRFSQLSPKRRTRTWIVGSENAMRSDMDLPAVGAYFRSLSSLASAPTKTSAFGSSFLSASTSSLMCGVNSSATARIKSRPDCAAGLRFRQILKTKRWQRRKHRSVDQIHSRHRRARGRARSAAFGGNTTRLLLSFQQMCYGCNQLRVQNSADGAWTRHSNELACFFRYVACRWNSKLKFNPSTRLCSRSGRDL